MFDLFGGARTQEHAGSEDQKESDDADEVFWAIVHSHVASPARPSPTDLRESHYPDSLYILVSLSASAAVPYQKLNGQDAPLAFAITSSTATSEVKRVTSR